MKDLILRNHGSICLLVPVTETGKDWIETNISGDEVQWVGTAVVVEPRYVADIVDGAINDGLTVGD